MPFLLSVQRVVDLLRLKAALQGGTELEEVPLHLPLQASPPLPCYTGLWASCGADCAWASFF